MTEVGLVSRC